MEIDFEACEDLVHFSQGVPYITHLLCIYSARAALADGGLGQSRSTSSTE